MRRCGRLAVLREDFAPPALLPVALTEPADAVLKSGCAAVKVMLIPETDAMHLVGRLTRWRG